MRSALDPKRAKESPGFFAAFPGFEPSCPSACRPDTLAYLGFGDPARPCSALLSQAGAEAPGIADGFADLAESLQRRGRIDLAGELARRARRRGGARARAADQPRPARRVERRPAVPVPELRSPPGSTRTQRREALAALQGPLADDRPGSEQAPDFGQEEIAGVEAHSLQVSPTRRVTYAIVRRPRGDRHRPGRRSPRWPAGTAGSTRPGVRGGHRGLPRRALAARPTSTSATWSRPASSSGSPRTRSTRPSPASSAASTRSASRSATADDVLATDARLLIGDPAAGRRRAERDSGAADRLNLYPAR